MTWGDIEHFIYQLVYKLIYCYTTKNNEKVHHMFSFQCTSHHTESQINTYE